MYVGYVCAVECRYNYIYIYIYIYKYIYTVYYMDTMMKEVREKAGDVGDTVG